MSLKFKFYKIIQSFRIISAPVVISAIHLVLENNRIPYIPDENYLELIVL